MSTLAESIQVMKDMNGNRVIAIGKLKYKLIKRLQLKNGLRKEYFKCTDCSARLQLFVDIERIELTSDHINLQCKRKVREWERNFGPMSRRLDIVLEEEEIVETSNGDETLMTSYVSVGSSSSSEESEESKIAEEDNIFDDTLITSLISVPDDSSSAYSSSFEVSFLDETVDDVSGYNFQDELAFLKEQFAKAEKTAVELEEWNGSRFEKLKKDEKLSEMHYWIDHNLTDLEFVAEKSEDERRRCSSSAK